jgi:hypothetical protein
MTAPEQPAKVSHDDWRRARLRRDMLARLGALAALGDRIGEAKKYARDMLATEADMNRIADALDQYPNAGDE